MPCVLHAIPFLQLITHRTHTTPTLTGHVGRPSSPVVRSRGVGGKRWPLRPKREKRPPGFLRFPMVACMGSSLHGGMALLQVWGHPSVCTECLRKVSSSPGNTVRRDRGWISEQLLLASWAILASKPGCQRMSLLVEDDGGRGTGHGGRGTGDGPRAAF